MRHSSILFLSVILEISFFSLLTSATIVYTDTHWDTAASGNIEPKGITMNDSYFWIVDPEEDKVYQYDNNGIHTGISWNVAGSGNPKLTGITMNDTYFWIVDSKDDEVYQHYHNGTYTGISWDTAGSGNTNPEGIIRNNTYFWIVDSKDSKIYQYNNDGTYTGISWDVTISGNNNPNGITMNNTYFWITDSINDNVYQYYHNGTYTGMSWDINVENSDPYGITMNDSHFWITDLIDDEVYQYRINTIPLTLNLMIEHQVNPTGIATNASAPYFNWTYSDDDSDTQYSWEIQVGTSPGALDMWNSGQIINSNTFGIYNGSTLSGDVTYHIQVRTNDSHENSTWTTGAFVIVTPTPVNITNTTGNYWINWTFETGAGDIIIDFFNVSANGAWMNDSSNLYHNATGLTPHTPYTINIFAYNITYGLSSSVLSDTMTVPNNAPTITNVSSTYEINEDSVFMINADYIDIDGDLVTFSDNSSDWDINTSTGVVSWELEWTDVGVHYYRITINDGYGGSDYVDFTVTVNGIQNTAITSIDTSFGSVISGTYYTDNIIDLSFKLTNSGSVIADVSAKFTSNYGGTYGLVNDTTVIGGSNFKLGNETIEALNDEGTPVDLTDDVPGENTELNYKVQLKIPAGQDALDYMGIIELTFS